MSKKSKSDKARKNRAFYFESGDLEWSHEGATPIEAFHAALRTAAPAALAVLTRFVAGTVDSSGDFVPDDGAVYQYQSTALLLKDFSP